MSSLGKKFSRKAQVLGKKIESKSRVLGQKANIALRMADTGLRKTENTLKNVIIPGSALVGELSGNPQLGALGYGLGSAALAGTKAIRNDIKPAQTVASRLEKLNIRKEGEELLNRVRESGQDNSFV
jgi:hypothetical protein